MQILEKANFVLIFFRKAFFAKKLRDFKLLIYEVVELLNDLIM